MANKKLRNESSPDLIKQLHTQKKNGPYAYRIKLDDSLCRDTEKKEERTKRGSKKKQLQRNQDSMPCGISNKIVSPFEE